MTPTPFSRVLVGYVPSEEGADARALGVDLAAACGADLVLASVVVAVGIEYIRGPTGPAVVHSGQRERAASALKEAAAELVGVAGLGHVERRLEASSSTARGLHDIAVSERADLVVVGSSHHGRLGQVLLGSVSHRLLSGAPCAVAVAPRGHAARRPENIELIAVAFDGSPESHGALRAAHQLATRTGARVQALIVIEPPAAIPGQFIPLPGLEPVVTIQRAEALAHQELAARAALDSAVHDLGGGAVVDQDVLFSSDPANAILDVVGADPHLLVVGSRAYGPIKRTLVGSMSAAILRDARCPVLVTSRTTVEVG